ncbi:hypothetical protein ACYSNO_03430 [Enterococcus sp. LJL98]
MISMHEMIAQLKQKKSDRFESIESYESVDDLISRLMRLNPMVTYEQYDQSLDKGQKHYILVIQNRQKKRFNVYTENDFFTLKALLENDDILG